VIWSAVVLGYLWLDRPSLAALDDVAWPLHIWTLWDGGWYLAIAADGYGFHPDSPAFFPLYPGLVALAGRALAGNYALAAVTISLASCAAVFVLVYRLAAARLGEAGALRTVVYLAVFPTTIFLGAAYSESLFLALAALSFLLAERDRFGWAGVVAGVAMLCRLVGVALLPALVLFAWKAQDRNAALRRLVPGLSLALLWPAYLWFERGNPVAFLAAPSAAEWDRELSPFGPLGGLAEAVHALFLGDPLFNGFQLALALSFVALAILAWRLFGAPYGVYGVLALAVPLSTPTAGGVPLSSFPRYALACFPAFMALAWLGRRRSIDLAFVVVCAALLGFTALLWADGSWIA
jgi:hypothetical protein